MSPTESLAIEERVVEGVSAPKLFAEHHARYQFAQRYVSGRRVLDVACGSGYGSRMLHDAGATEVIGLDLDEEAVAYADERYGSDGVMFFEGDACQPPQLEPFNVIVSFETIEHLQQPTLFLESCRDLLVPDGLMIVSTPYRHRTKPDGSPLNPHHVQEWRTDEFAALLHGVFDHVELFGQALKLEKKPWLPLPRSLAKPIARVQGVRVKNVHDIYPLPGPWFWGLWRSYPGYVVAVCRSSTLSF